MFPPAPRGNPMILASGLAARTDATSRLVGCTHQRSKSSGDNDPAQVSNICRHSAPTSGLSDEVVGRCVQPLVDQNAKGGGLARCQDLCRHLVQHSPAGHHISGNRPWRSAKSNERYFFRQGRFDASHCFVDRRQYRRVAHVAYGVERIGAHQGFETRSLALDEAHGLAECVGDHNRRKRELRHRNRNAGQAGASPPPPSPD